MRVLLGLLIICVSWMSVAQAESGVRIKDITHIEGVRENQLFGVGLVVGLNRTGGRSLSTQQMAIDMLRRMDVTTAIARQGLLDNVFLSTNISMVMVTAELPAFARAGTKLDVSVSALDDAASLKGGQLLLTQLKGADNEVYAVAQGSVSIGGVNLEAQIPQSALLHHPTSGRVVGGAIVEKEALGKLHTNHKVRLLLQEPDFDTAREIMNAINKPYPLKAKALDSATVEVEVPRELKNHIPQFISEVGLLEVHPDRTAKIIINERTGTVIVGQTVRIATIAISHGNLVIRPEEPSARRARTLGPAASAVLGLPPDNAAGQAQQQQAAPGAFPPGTRVNVVDEHESITVSEFARALNVLGTSPKDLIAIFQALKRAGALHAELVIM